MQAEIERAERANEMLKTENDCLMRDVENLRRGEDASSKCREWESS